VDRDIDDRDGNVDSNQQDIDDSGVGNEAGEEETEDLKRAVRKKTSEVCCRRSRARSAAGGAGRGQSWLFPADFWPILGCFGLFKTKSWLIPVDISPYRHSLSVSAEEQGED
jgi:hypothetical protein